MPALGISVKLQAAAAGHADVMARTGRMAHSGLGDGDLALRLRSVAYTFRGAGENVAWGQRDVAAVMTSWMDSPGHRAKILGNFSEAGLAVSYGTGGVPFWCAVFGSPAIAVPGAYAGQLPYTVGTPEVVECGTSATSSVAIASD